jgi:hypothetical protein
MRIYKIAHAGFNLGESSRRITDMIYEKIKSISLEVTGVGGRIPTESEFQQAGVPLEYSFYIDDDEVKSMQENIKMVPFLPKNKDHSSDPAPLSQKSYYYILSSKRAKKIKFVLTFCDQYKNFKQGHIIFPGIFHTQYGQSIEIKIFVLPNVINDGLHLALTNTVEHELQHYAQYISNVPWFGSGFNSQKDGYKKYFNQLDELQAFISGTSAKISKFTMGEIGMEEMKSIKSEEEALVLAKSKIPNLPQLIMERAKVMQLSPKNTRDFIQSVIRMTNKKIRESVHELFMASREGHENI